MLLATLVFSSYLLKQPHDFTACEWILTKIGRCLSNPEARHIFILTGEPSIGKTVIAVDWFNLPLIPKPLRLITAMYAPIFLTPITSAAPATATGFYPMTFLIPSAYNWLLIIQDLLRQLLS